MGRELIQAGTKTTTINSYLRHIKAALRWAIKTKIDDSDALSPCFLAAMPDLTRFKEPRRLPRALSRKEVLSILWHEKDLAKRALWRFFLATGLRRGEVTGLDWRYVRLDVPEPYCVVIGKGDKQRAVPLLPEAVRALEQIPRYDMGPVWRFRHHLKPGLHTYHPDTLSHCSKTPPAGPGLTMPTCMICATPALPGWQSARCRSAQSKRFWAIARSR